MSDEHKNKISRRNFLKMLGVTGAGIAAGASGILPLPVDMSKTPQTKDIRSTSISEDDPGLPLSKFKEWVHPCMEKKSPDRDCRNCGYYFCPLEAETVRRWRRNEYCEILHGKCKDEQS